jgi:hypothetical protein
MAYTITTNPVPIDDRRGRLMGSLGAAIGLLLPKCPLCRMTITGSTIAGSTTRVYLEVFGVALFVSGIWQLLRRRGIALMLVPLVATTSTALLLLGARLIVNLESKCFFLLTIFAGAWLESLYFYRSATCEDKTYK